MNNIIDKFSFQGVLHDIEPASSHREATEVSLGYEVLHGNKSFISQITKTDTIYEIRDYFDLNGGTFTLPENCVLKFEGGLLSNGIINGNGVVIESPLVRIFSDNITLIGDFNCDFYPEWFGAVAATNNNLTYTEVVNPNFSFTTTQPIVGTFNKWIGFSTIADLEKDGLLKKIKFSGTALSNHTFNIRISKKNRDSNGNITGCSTVLDNLSVILLSGNNEIDVSDLNIIFKKNYVLEIYIETIQSSSPIYNVIKYQKGDSTKYVQYREQTIAAPGFNMFTIDVVISYNEQIDNTAAFNNAITQIYNMNGAHDLILTGAYLIKDTIFLKPKVSLIGRYGKTMYDIAVGNKEIGSGFLVDFEDNNRYAIDSCLTQLTADRVYSGKKQAIINYNHLWFDAEAAAEDSYTLSDKIVYNNGNAAADNSITGKLWANGWRKGTNIKNITIQPLNKPTQSSEIPFGGIRLIGWYSGTIDSVTIQGFAVCLNIAESWACCINRLNITTYYIGVYFGKFCTQCDIRNSDIERVDGNVVFNHKDAALVYRHKDKLLLPYDEKGRVEGDEGFTYSITKYIAEAETVADDFITNYKSTQLLTVAIMTESYTYDQTKVLLDNIIFQSIDGIFINTNNCVASFNFCYIEAVSKLGFYTYSGLVRWLNPSFGGNIINPYGAVTFEGTITIENMTSPRCYPSYTMEDVKSGKTRPRYYVTPQALYYDKFTVTPQNSNTSITNGVPMFGTVAAGSIAAAKQLVPINNTYYIGEISFMDKYKWHEYTELAAGLERYAWIPFKRVLELYDPKVATFHFVFGVEEFSAGGVLLKDKDFTFMRYNDTSTNAMFNSTTPMRLQDSNVKFIKIKLACYTEDKNVFEVAGKCSIWADYSDCIIIRAKLIKLVSDNNKPVELDFFYNVNMYPYEVYNYYLSHLNEYGIKYTVKISTLKGSQIYTNTTPPTKGVEKGEIFIYNGKTLVWNGSSWDTQLIHNYDLYVALGAEYNNTGADIIKTAPWGEVTHKVGCWYYNGLGDLSTNDMLQTYSHKNILAKNARFRYGTVRQDLIRTNMPIEFAPSVSQIPIDSVMFFFRCAKIQVLRWARKESYYGQTEVTFDTTNVNVMPKMGANMQLAFAECFKLQYVYPINVSSTTNFQNAFLMGVNCGIKDVRLYGLKASVSFKDCPYLTKECLLYIIANANPVTAITITLHATAYANLAEDADIVTKLNEKNAALSANGGSIGLISA